ncbi:fatty acid desaturase family protein [Sphingomonas sp. LH128]|uniref:fatty acid desaturase family protein n=1 Tax=Sphingomonas sp. LH128 TaxID=473781 RepID=UPI0026C3095E
MLSADQQAHAGPTSLETTAQDWEDRDLLTVAATLGREFGKPSPAIYWTDLLCTAILAYGALTALLLLPIGLASVPAYGVAVLAFYRGLSFIHELTHLRPNTVRGFSAAWNVLFGVPLLVPSFMYEGVHTVHHARTTYGTRNDPEYLPFSALPRRASLRFLVVSALIPLGLLLRFAVLAPLSIVIPRLRRIVITRYSALAINPSFRRRDAVPTSSRSWLVLEVCTAWWSILVVALTALGAIAMPRFLTCLAVGVGVAVINQIRTLASHAWGNATDRPISLTAQYLDSVNVPPPAALPALWAPVGLRYHALHHLLPSVPYHSLGRAHLKLSSSRIGSARCSTPDYPSMPAVLEKILKRKRASQSGDALATASHQHQSA